MKIEMRQIAKGPCSAEFILASSGQNIGKIEFNCNGSSKDGVIKILLEQKDGLQKEVCIKHNDDYTTRNKRIYEIKDETAENNISTLYIGSCKLETFRKYKSVRFYYQCNSFTLHPLNIETENSTIFKNGNPIATIHQTDIRYEDLRDYNINVSEEQDILVCVILSSYLYVISNFKSNKEKIYEKIYDFFYRVFRKGEK